MYHEAQSQNLVEHFSYAIVGDQGGPPGQVMRDSKLDFWINKGYNVLFVGKHGVGKTAMITQAFERAGLKWKYFSASTMDPWVDFIGVPKEVKDENGKSYLELVRPKEFSDDEVEALFFDEYNRSHKKVRNAVMELIQFKSINGRKFNNLKIIWAAINPDDDESQDYDVEKMDPAQEDRFHVRIEVPYKPSVRFFTQKYGKEIAEAACAWWNELPKPVKDKVSPRRLDYAMHMHSNQGDLRDVLPKESNVNKLLMTLRDGPIKKQLKKHFDSKDRAEAKKFLAQENNYAASIQHILKTKKYVEYYLPLLSQEKLAALIGTNTAARKYIAQKSDKIDVFGETIKVVMAASGNRRLIRELRKYIPKQAKAVVAARNWKARLDNLDRFPVQTTQQRYKIYDNIRLHMPSVMKLAEAKKTCEILNKVLSSTQYYTVRSRMPRMGYILTACFSRIAAETNDKTAVAICNNNGWHNIHYKVLTQNATSKTVKIKKVAKV